jgi:hypothetical protein
VDIRPTHAILSELRYIFGNTLEPETEAMPKTTTHTDLTGYAPVAARIELFYERFPDGRIVTRLRSRTRQEVIFVAEVYRGAADGQPAATGWAAEREGDGDINLVACLENTETSAIGRALANLGFTASTQRPSAEEMLNVARRRGRMGVPAPVQASPNRRQIRETPVASTERRRLATNLLMLIGEARARGLRTARAERWRERLSTNRYSEHDLRSWERRLGDWLRHRG